MFINKSTDKPIRNKVIILKLQFQHHFVSCELLTQPRQVGGNVSVKQKGRLYQRRSNYTTHLDNQCYPYI